VFSRRCLFLAAVLIFWPNAAAGFFDPQDSTSGREVRTDIAGDPLPPGAVARLGVTRFRHTGWHTGMAVSADSKRIVTTSENGRSVRFWELATGKLLHEIREANVRHPTIAFSPNGKWFVTVGFSGDEPRKQVGSLCFWNPTTLKVQNRLAFEKDAPSRLLFTPDSKFVIGNVKGDAVVLEAEAGKELLRYRLVERGEISALAVSPDGRLIAASAENQPLVKLWDWQSPDEPRILRFNRERGCTTLVFTPDGKKLLGRGRDTSDDGILIWDMPTGKLAKEWFGHRSLDYADKLAVHPDGKLVAVSQFGNRVGDKGSGSIALWNLETGSLEKSFVTPGHAIAECAFTPDKRWLVARSGRGVNVWDLQTGKEVADYDAAHNGTCWTLAMSAKGILATACDDGAIGFWDSDGKLQRKRSDSTRANGVAFSPDGSLLLTAGTSNTIDLWEVQSGKKLYSVPGHGNYGGLRVLAFSRDGAAFCSFGDDFYFRRWRTANGKAILEKLLVPKGMDAKKIANKGDEPRDDIMFFMMLRGAQFSQDAKTLVLAGQQGVQLFDTATGNEVKDFKCELDLSRHSFALSPDGKWLLASGFEQPKVKDSFQAYRQRKYFVAICELSNGQIIRRTPVAEKSPWPVAFSPDGKYYAVSSHLDSGLSTVRIWESASGKEVHVLSELPETVRAMIFSNDNRRLYTSMQDTSVLVWQLPFSETR
jgi:WD40 repeat protein